jgi:hypothetical protein
MAISSSERSLAITRSAGPARVGGIFATSLLELFQILAVHGHDSLAVADLTLGAWRPRAIYHDLAPQLGLQVAASSSTRQAAKHTVADTLHYADTIAASIDIECLGDRQVISALMAAGTIVAATRGGAVTAIVVLAPRGSIEWGADNLHFVRFLAEGLAACGRRLLIVSTDFQRHPNFSDFGIAIDWLNEPQSGGLQPPGAGQRNSLLAVTPGIIEPDLFAQLVAMDEAEPPPHVTLSSGHVVVCPAARGLDAPLTDAADRLASLETSPDWLRACAQCSCRPCAVDPGFLRGHALRMHASGAYDVAVTQLKRAFACCTDVVEKSQIQLQLHGILIALLRFPEIIETAEVGADCPPALRGLLHQSRGWAHAMLGAPLQARKELLCARELLHDHIGLREFLYLMNISALAELKGGRIESSFAMEKQIESRLGQISPRDWHLEYINSLNLARLFKRRGESAAAEHYFDLAFATYQGTRSSYDPIYENVIRARLASEHGRMDKAFACWTRAALHWVSHAAPEALPRRTLMSILGAERAAAPTVVERISAVLMQQFENARSQVDGRSAELTPLDPVPTFARISQVGWRPEFENGAELIGQDGWSAVGVTVDIKEQFTGPAHRALRTRLAQLIEAKRPYGGAGFGSYLIVDDVGDEMPGSVEACLNTCMRLNIRTMTYHEKRSVFSDSVSNDLERAASVKLAPGVDRIDDHGLSATVAFKRYRPQDTLDHADADIVRTIGQGSTVTRLASELGQNPSDVVAAIRRLEKRRILTLHIDE